MPSQNMPLWLKDHFDLKATENQQIQGEFSGRPLIHLKAGPTFSFVTVSPFPVPGREDNSCHWRQ